MAQYIIIGSWCEYIAGFHCLADTEAQALQKYKEVFTEEQRTGLCVTVSNCDDESHMKAYWKYDGYQYYSGGYSYFL